MKKNFLTGLAILLPIALTIWIVSLFLNMFTNPFIGIVRDLLQRYDLDEKLFYFFNREAVILFLSRMLIFFLLLGIVFLAGFLGRRFVIKPLFRRGDSLLHRIPLVNNIYKASQDVVKTLLSPKKKSFSQVVLAPFPHSASYCIGLITRLSQSEQSDPEHLEKISVFIPGTPNPTMGFNLLFRKEQLIFLDMKVEDALKYIVSCGVMTPSFDRKQEKSE